MSVARSVVRAVVPRRVRNAVGAFIAPATPADPRDDFMRWIGYANPGWLAPGNVESFIHCVDRLPSEAAIVEIGTFAGLSTNTIIQALRRSGRKNPVFSVDPWSFEDVDMTGTIAGSKLTYAAYREHLIDLFRRNTELFSGDRLPHHLVMTSDEFFLQWRQAAKTIDFFGRDVTLGGSVAMVYIDGLHTFDQTLADFENTDAVLQPGGFVIFDDSLDSGPYGCTQAAQQAAARPDYRVIAKNPNYCLQKVALAGSPQLR